MRRGPLAGLLALVTVLAAGCTSGSSGRSSPTPTPSGPASVPSDRTSSASSSAPAPTTPSSSAARAACPATYAAPDPSRPVIDLRFDVSDDHASVTGHEAVRFTPDRPITELVFRLTANTAPTVAEGTSITVTRATADLGSGAARYVRAGAATGTQGGLLVIPLRGTVAAGAQVNATVDFVLRLGVMAFDRFGRFRDYAWFASAQPLLAWERGYGWHTEPLIRFTAESATSEASDIRLTVTAPARDVVIASGRPVTATSVGGDRRRWQSRVTTARDVSVAVGPFVVRDSVVAGTHLRVAAGTASEAAEVVREQTRAMTELTRRFGPFPYPSLSVSVLPGAGGGIEYPSSIFLLSADRTVVVHETAHQWFYAMVGDSQAQHAWLDEAFASYAEQLVDDDAPPTSELDRPGVVDTPTASYGDAEGDYYRVTYDKGAAALHAARAAVGAARFDAAIRCYVNANAWRIAQPKDLASALRSLPAAVAVLKRAGALR